MSSISDSLSIMQASISQLESGTMTPSNTILVAGVLDMVETLDGFAQRLRELRKSKNLSQTELEATGRAALHPHRPL
jgi:transcriptional regulator with XRE-family HTH domain